MTLMLILMTVAIALLWKKVRVLTERVDTLAFAGVTQPDGAEGRPPAPARARPVVPPLRPAEPPRIVPPAAPVAVPLPPAEAGEPDAIRAHASRFEDVFGRRLPVWAGGITLAVAGVLIVRYSIQAGLLSPVVRVALGFIFGGGLIAGAEAALRHAARVRDPRVRQALSGAGIATLYATILAAANLYGLIGPLAAFVGLAGVTALAGGLSIRFGAPSALLGLVGGLAAPALVGSTPPDVPVLTLYLALAVGGLGVLGRRQRWWWLGAAALAGGFGWGAVLIAGGALGLADALAVGGYTLALAIGLPLLLVGDRRGVMRLAGAMTGCAQLAALVAVGGFAPLHWGLYALISGAIVRLSRRDALFADVPALGLGVAILLGFAWPRPGAIDVALLLVGIVILYGVPAALRTWRADARPSDAPCVLAIALTVGVLPLVSIGAVAVAPPALAGAALAAAVAARGWRNGGRREDRRFAMLAIGAAVLLALAAAQAFVPAAWAPVAALLALALVRLGTHAGDERVARGGRVFAGGALALLAGDAHAAVLADMGAPGGWPALATWGVPAAAAAWAAWREAPRLAWAWQPAVVLIGYGAAAQIVPAGWLPLLPALIVAALAAWARDGLRPALAAALVPMLGWAAAPAAHWLFAGALSLFGRFVPLRDWPALADVAWRIALPGLALAFAARRVALPPRTRRIAVAAVAVALTIAAHVGFKQMFAIETGAGFIRHALAERTVWEMLLGLGAAILWTRGVRRPAIVAAGGALLHFGWFTGIVANPLWVAQAAGLWLPLAYLMAGVLLWVAPAALPGLRRRRDWLMMALIAAGGVTLLRQAMHLPMVLTAGTAPGEQIARSILALGLAGGFLWVGIAHGLRDWRIASLGLMLLAVAKVFLFDAAGLDGIARIASFAALGFSLIGVGWLYSRYLPDGSR